MIEAVLFDLDDTLYPQSQFLEGAWQAVAQTASRWSVDVDAFAAALGRIAAEGSDRGRIIDRALVDVGRADVPVEPLARAFRVHRPRPLTPYPGAVTGVEAVRRRVPVAVVTDGDPASQTAKLDALGLTDAFDAVVLSDALGRRHRKPHPAPFLAAAALLGVDPSTCLMVGDRPDKDVAGALGAGLLGAVRVKTGEHQAMPDHAECLAVVPDIAAASRWLCRRLESTSATSPPSTAART